MDARLVGPSWFLLELESRGETNTDAAAARRPAVRQSSSGLQRLKIAQAGFLTGATHHITHVAEQQRKHHWIQDQEFRSAAACSMKLTEVDKRYDCRAVCEEGLLRGLMSDTVRAAIVPIFKQQLSNHLSWLCFHCNSGCRPLTVWKQEKHGFKQCRAANEKQQ